MVGARTEKKNLNVLKPRIFVKSFSKPDLASSRASHGKATTEIIITLSRPTDDP